MGGADAVLEKAREAFDRGEYRWVAEVVNHVVFADPTNRAARELQADTLEQMGYQSEAGTGVTAYLQAPAPHGLIRSRWGDRLAGLGARR